MVRSDLPQLYEALHLRRDFDVVYLDREAMDKNPVIWMLDTLDYSSSPRIQLAFSFDKNTLANWVSEISFSRLCSFTLYSAEAVSYTHLCVWGRDACTGPPPGRWG